MNRYLAIKVGVLLAALFMVVVIFGWDLLGDMDSLQKQASIVEASNHQSHQMHAIEMGISTNIKVINDFLITGDARLIKGFEQHNSKLLATIVAYEKSYKEAGSFGLETSVRSIQKIGREVFQLQFIVGNMEGPILAEEIKIKTREAIAELTQAHHHLDESVNEAMKMMAALRTDMFEETIVLMLALLLAIAFLTYILYVQVVTPIVQMRKEVQRIGSGDFNVRCKVSSKDEIGELGLVFNAMGEALKEREAELNQSLSLAAYQEKMNTMGIMTAGIAHEVGNPLSAISMLLEVAQRKLTSKDYIEVQYALKTGLQEVERMEQIIQRILNFCYPEQHLKATYFDLSPVIDDAIALAKIYPNHKSIIISSEIPKTLRAAYGNEGVVTQVLYNLIHNALSACKDSGDVSISVRHHARDLWIDVSDTGHGIPEHLRGEVFKPNFTTKTKGQGMGLGLAISKELIGSMQGSLRLIDTNTQSCCFRISLPTRENEVSV